MSYIQHFSAQEIINNIEKNYASVSRFIQPDWLRSYYDTVTAANFEVVRATVAEVEKTLPFNKN